LGDGDHFADPTRVAIDDQEVAWEFFHRHLALPAPARCPAKPRMPGASLPRTGSAGRPAGTLATMRR